SVWQGSAARVPRCRATRNLSVPRAIGSEEPERLRAIADENVLRLLVVVEHHLVRLAADARLLLAAEGRVRGIEVVAVGLIAARLDAAAHAVGGIAIA